MLAKDRLLQGVPILQVRDQIWSGGGKKKGMFFCFVFMVRTKYFSVLMESSYRIESRGRFRERRGNPQIVLSEDGRWPPETRCVEIIGF